MSRGWPALLLAALAGVPGPLAGQGLPPWRTAQPERPTVATHAYPVAPGVVEIEAGVQAFRPSAAAETDAPLVVKLGAVRDVQVEAAWGWTRSRAGDVASSGITDLTLDAKLHLLHDAPVLANFSVQPGVVLPTGSPEKGTGTGATQAALLLISSRTLGRLSLDLNAGATWRRDASSIGNPATTLLTASAGWDFGRGHGWVLELYGYPGTSGDQAHSPQVGLLTGPTLAVRPWLVLDLGVVANLEGLLANSAYAGVTWNVGRIRGWPGT